MISLVVMLLIIALLYLGRRFFTGARCNVSRDLYNQIIIITGSSSGVGLETARALAKRDATIIFACRNQKKTQSVIEEISKETGNSNLKFMKIDFDDLKTVKTFVKEFKKKYSKLHILINNSGIFEPSKRRVTKNDIEAHFATNYLGVYYLTNLLLDVIRKTEGSRIVNVSSKGQAHGKFFWDDLMLEKDYDMQKAYNQSKLANVTFTKALQKRLNQENTKVVCLHPGFVITPGLDNFKKDPKFKTLIKLGYPFMKYFMKTPEQGAQTSIYCSLEDLSKLEVGGYYSECTLKEVNPEALKEENQRLLWETSEKILKEKLGQDIWDLGSQ